jgi:hypothetical protein
MPQVIELQNKAGYQSAWAVIRKLGEFTRQDVIFELSKEFGDNVNADTIKSYIQRLTRGGFVVSAGRKRTNDGHSLYIYKLIKDIGNTAPRLKADGSLSLNGAVNESLWRTMKILGTFNLAELQAAASTDTVQPSADSTREYCEHLRRAGYLRLKRGRYTALTSRYTGPQAPIVTKVDTVYDQNNRKIVYIKPVEVEL